MDDAAWELLHEVRLRGRVDADGRGAADVLVAAGLVHRARDRLVITPEGRERHAAWARFADGSDEAAAARRAYEAFLPLNVELLRLCSDWQVRPGGVPNDHRDARYDWGLVERLHRLQERIGPVVRRCGRTAARFAGYRDRLAGALERVEEGEHDWFTSPRIDSYHTVWMQLHEDLLAALGLERRDETQPGAG